MVGSLPLAVTVREVGPRDGLQNEPRTLTTHQKRQLVEALLASGLARIELTSFVHPQVVPQLADAELLLASLGPTAGVTRSVLVPNRKGLARALPLAEHFEQVTVFLSASESHNQANLGTAVERSLAESEAVAATAREEGLRVEAVISTSFGCPYEGYVPPARVIEIALSLRAAGVAELALADTTGMANPHQVINLFGCLREAVGEEVELTAHFHNTRGQGMANVLAALEVGVASFESSIGELGGCPVPPGATGNIATEDLVLLLGELGIRTGVDLDQLLKASAVAEQLVGRPLSSHTPKAGPIRWFPSGEGSATATPLSA